MTSIQPTSAAPVSSGGGPLSGSSLADVVDTILDKGLVIDAQIGVSVVGIQLLTIDARVVIASVDTYLRFAEAVGRLDIQKDQGKGLPEVIEGTTKAVEGAKKGSALGKAGDILGELVEPREERDNRQPDRKRRSRG